MENEPICQSNFEILVISLELLHYFLIRFVNLMVIEIIAVG